MENEKLTYINSRGERLELGVDSVYHCNISKDVEGISGVTSVIYSTNSMGQHGDTYVGQRIEARDIDVVCKADSNGSNTHYGNMGACACRYLRRQGRNKDTDAEYHRPAV